MLPLGFRMSEDYVDVFVARNFVLLHGLVFSSILILGTTKESYAAFELSDYDQVPVQTVLSNNGHSVKLSSTYTIFTPTGT